MILYLEARVTAIYMYLMFKERKDAVIEQEDLFIIRRGPADRNCFPVKPHSEWACALNNHVRIYVKQ